MDKNTILDVSKIKNTVADSLNQQWVELINFLPNLIGAFIILIFGLIIAFILKKISTSLFRKVGLDRISRKAGVSDVMQDAGLAKSPSILAGKIIFWLVFFVFLVPAANALGLTELVNLFVIIRRNVYMLFSVLYQLTNNSHGVLNYLIFI